MQQVELVLLKLVIFRQVATHLLVEAVLVVAIAVETYFFVQLVWLAVGLFLVLVWQL